MIWKEQYRIGIERIDSQHIELFHRVTDFVETLQRPGDWAEQSLKVASTMRFMQQYVITHFRDEETFQRLVHYPNAEEHARIHAAFCAVIQDFANRFEQNGYQKPDAQQLAGKLLAWLINHIVVTDHKIADYVNRNGNGALV